MEVKELRVGNLVQDEGDSVQYVYSISKDEIELSEDRYGKEVTYYRRDDVCPLPISEGLLFKLGFEYSGSRNFYNIGNFYIESCASSWAVYYTDKGELICFINHTHQLQNLFFALTNREL